MIFKFAFNSIIIIFLYANIYIIYDFHKCFNFLSIFLIFKFSCYCFFNIKNDLPLFLISKMLIFKKSFFIFIIFFCIVFVFKLNLHFIFKKSLIFLINIIIIVFISFLFINIIILYLFIDIYIMIIIEFFVKYNVHNDFNFFIISIDFFYLKY